MYNLSFISEENFEKHVRETIALYHQSLRAMDLNRFNENIVDPIKLLFDKFLYRKTFDEIVSLEIQRQRDKTNTNAIGYFHQNLFKFLKNCEVPKQGWDIIFTHSHHKICVEMKNKHNTMNSSSAKTTMLKMQNHILENPKDDCYLVEVIAAASQNVVWKYSVGGSMVQNEHI